MQKPSSFVKWREETPEDFVFAIKGGRYITHVKRLVGAEVALANFFATGVLSLGAKLGPILWQLPPNFQFDADKLAAFFLERQRPQSNPPSSGTTSCPRIG